MKKIHLGNAGTGCLECRAKPTTTKPNQAGCNWTWVTEQATCKRCLSLRKKRMIRWLWLKCNVNDAVKFIPGLRGREAMLKEYGLKYMDNVHPGWEKDGAVIQMQLWEFMRVIGPITRMGVSDDYKTAIELEVYEESLKEALNEAIHTSD